LASALVRELIEAGVHFGHRVSRWNPKMAPYIFGKRNSIHIIDIRQTVKGLLRAKKFVSAIVAQGHDALIVGTKRQARDIVVKQAQRVGMHYVSERWLGGTLTNFKTIRSRLARLEELESLETTGRILAFNKKERSTIDRERRKITRNLEGIRRMTRLPGALVILDVRREYIAVKEARKLGIPTVCLVDTDSDPDSADVIIPGNDDAMRAIEIIVTQIADAIEEGKRARPAPAPEGEAAAAGPGGRPRRSRRLTTSEIAEQEEKAAAEADRAEGAMPIDALASPESSTTAAPVADTVQPGSPVATPG
jgi:small subunit ribosomal protein S2